MDTGYDKRNRRLKIFFQVFKMPTTAKQIYEERESRYKMTKLKIGRYRKKERWRDGNIKREKGTYLGIRSIRKQREKPEIESVVVFWFTSIFTFWIFCIFENRFENMTLDIARLV